MTEFIASNGYHIERAKSGDLLFFAHGEELGHLSHGRQRALREFFAAHPEPKPWHEAKPGEVWELTHDGNLGAWHVNGGGKEFFAPGALLDIDNEDITAGRRIWPEVSDV